MKNVNKIVVFDLDETLGYFVEFGMFWEALINFLNYKNYKFNLTQDDFNNILDLYPEFKRPNIIEILEYLKEQKQKCFCNKILIYTNNQGPRHWVEYIKNYFEYLINFKLFDQIIGAFKINGKNIEICRTSHLKCHKDLVRCSKIPLHTHICFLDDTFFPKMSNKNIYYINIKPYIHNLNFDLIIKRFTNSSFNKKFINSNSEFKEYILTFMNNFIFINNDKNQDDLSIDKLLTSKILDHLKLFFNIKYKPITTKNQILSKKNKNKTRKLINNNI